MGETSLSDLDPEQLRDLLSVAKEPDACSSAEKGVSSVISPQFGSWIDKYKLIERLGEGGMAVVYLAEQEYPVNRKVAIKIIRPGMNSAKVITRFEAERQTLTFLSHPNIAQIYDAGTTKDGLPYFVMEYVKGLPITEYCDNHKLTVKERLRLFQQVCHAVQHAHQKGIIHRDIKPSNMLVSIQDDQAVPKIIDFGIAKAIDQPLTERTLDTEDNQLLGTPEYMSPEQADMATANIDTRTDVFSLGVLLYVLLTGVLPFEPEKFRDSGIENIRKTILETDPKTPSTRLTKLGDEARTIAQNRQMEIRTLTRYLKKELEWIPLKAMRKERSDRYRSASELADDIENYLMGAPLIAGPTGTGYKLKKFVRRNRMLVGGIAAVLLVSVIGTIVSMTYALGQASALAHNKAMADFLNNDILDPLASAEMQDATIREVFDTAIEKIGTRFSDYPLLEASMRFQFGNIYNWQFFDYSVALPNLERALELRQQYEKNRPLVTMNWLGLAYVGAGRYKEAEAMFRTIVESIEEEGLKGRIILYCAVKSHLGHMHLLQGRYDEAERYLREALDVAPWPKESSAELIYRGMLAGVFMARGRYVEAEQLYDNIVRTGRSLQKKGDPKIKQIIASTLNAMKQLGVLQTLHGNFKKAESLLEAALKEGENEWGPEHFRTVSIKIALAVLRTRQGRHEEAGSLFDEILRNMQGNMDDDHPELLKTMSLFGVLRREQGQDDAAEKLLRQSLEGQREKLGPDHPQTLESMHELAVLYKKQDCSDKAEPLLLEALKGRRLKLGDTHPYTLESWNNLIELYKAWGKSEKAEEWRIKLPQTETVDE